MSITYIALECDNIAFFEELQSIIARVSSPSHAKKSEAQQNSRIDTRDWHLFYLL